MKVFMISHDPISMNPSDLLLFLNSRMEILNWYVPYAGSMLIVTDYVLPYLTKLIELRFPIPSFIVTELNQYNTDGKMPQLVWNFISQPTSIRGEAQSNAGALGLLGRYNNSTFND